MSMPTLLGPALALSLVFLGCGPRQPEPLGQRDVAAIREFLDQWLEANRTSDPSELAVLVTEDAVLMLPGMPALEGRTAFLSFLRGLQYQVLEVSAKALEIDGRDDLAYLRGTFTQTLTVADRAEPMINRGNYLFLLRKQPDGPWLCHRLIWSFDIPPSG